MNSPAIIVLSNVLAISLWIAVSPVTVFAFDPPVDRSGPLEARIVAPEVITDTSTEQSIQVVLKNLGVAPLTGTLQLGVIDNWKVAPADAQTFHAPPGQETRYDFRIQAGNATYSAHYPIHAVATFPFQGKMHTVHPILIVETKLAAPLKSSNTFAWEPFALTANRAWAILRLPVHRAVISVYGQPAQVMPVGWMGSADVNRASIQVQLEHRLGESNRDVISIHPPWREGSVGAAWIEYPLKLPDASSIALKFSTAVTPNGDGDGVTFRVRVAPHDIPDGKPGETVFERHSAAKTWEQGEVDLSRFAGQSIRLQLESHPGPANNTSFDQSYWAEPTLVVGQPPQPLPFPPGTTENSTHLGKVKVGESSFDVRVWEGSRGLLDSVFGISNGQKQMYFRGFRIRVMGIRVDDPASPITIAASPSNIISNGYEVLHRCNSIHGSFDLIGRVEIRDETLRVGFRLANAPPAQPWVAPHIEELAIEEFDQRATRIYAGHGNVIQNPELFDLTFDGHRLATSHVGFDFEGGLSLVQAVDLPPERLIVEPASHHYSLHVPHDATLILIPGATVWEASHKNRESNGYKPAPGVERLAGRFVFDLWGGNYQDSCDQLQRAFRYGLTDSAVVWHNWQRWGYDYRLPEIYPPNTRWGSETELKRMRDVCHEARVLFALHDNYIDMYPDAEGFSYEREIAFHANATPVRAWFNEGRQAQSYRFRADRVESHLQNNLKVIHEGLSPTAYFIDVWSSARPYDYWTSDGRFVSCVQTRDTWANHFNWIRDLLGDRAPQISESGHDQLIGALDGAQTNHLRVDKPSPGDQGGMVWNIVCADAERTPWFDFAHHDRFILHGAGYSNRYAAGLDHRLHGIYSDDYIATEVLTGHPGMVSQPFGRDVVRKYWLTQDLMRALALRTMESVEYVENDLHRQQVAWSGRGKVWVNRGKTDWETAGYILPEFGFAARVETREGLVTAAISRRQGVIVETASSPDAIYVNGRCPVTKGPQIRPRFTSFEPSSPRSFNLLIHWETDTPLPEGYQPFLHFVDSEGEIAFQASYDVTRFLSQEPGRIPLAAVAMAPAERQVGEQFELRVGLYTPGRGGTRLPLLGNDDGDRRIRLGVIELIEDATGNMGVRWRQLTDPPDRHLARQNVQATAIDFGPVITADGCRLIQSKNSLLLLPLPESANSQASYKLRWDRLPWRLPPPTHIEAIDEEGEVLRRVLAPQNLEVHAEQDAFAYRFTSDS